LQARKDYLTEQLIALGFEDDRADATERQMKDRVVESIKSGEIFVAPA